MLHKNKIKFLNICIVRVLIDKIILIKAKTHIDILYLV